MKAITFFISLVFILATGCSSSKITSTWVTPDTLKTPLNKIMVVSLAREADRTIRQKMEEHMINDIKHLGYNAVSAYNEYGPKAFENMDEKAVLEKLQNSGVDAIITIVLLSKEKENLYRPAAIINSPYAVRYNRFWGYYTTLSDRIYTPGYYETTTKYFWESNMYCLCDKSLLYSAQTQSFDPVSTEALAHEYGEMIVANMVKKKILLNKQPATE
jgi:hypothetical protein